MTIGVGNAIDNSDYNDIVTRVNQTLGHGTGDAGYGQNSGLSHVAADTDVTAAQLEAARLKLNLISNHQSGSDTSINQFYSGNIIGAEQGSTTTENAVNRSNSDVFTINNPDNSKGFNDLISSGNSLYGTRDDSGGTSLSTSTVYDYGTANLSFTSTWQRIRAVVQVDFAGGYNSSSNDGTLTAATANDHRRHFFNAGGKILLATRGQNNSGSKGNDWNTIIEAVGDVVISASSVTASSGTASLSFRELTSTYQTILTKSGSSGVYAENEYKIEARTVSGGLQFRLTYDDNDAGDQTGSGPGVDEPVNTDVQIRVRHTVPTSGVVVPAGTWSIPTALATY